MSRTTGVRGGAALCGVVMAAVALGGTSVARAGDLGAGLRPLGMGWDWWLPPNYSYHGGAIDQLFTVIFWVTMIIMILVEGVMAYFLIRYRHNPNRPKAVFTHGNTRLEMAWTLAPAVILLVLAMFSKRVWDNYRYSPLNDEKEQAEYVVIGERFKWNFVYAGPDGKVGNYLIYPKPTDAKWPQRWDPEKKQKVDVSFGGVPGPAYLPHDKALKAIGDYIQTENPLGKDFADPLGADDDWSKTPGRPQFIPVDTAITIHLTSKDVIHDYFLPNFRVKLDAVPGMKGLINYKAMPGCETVKTYKIDDPALIGKTAWLDWDVKGVDYDRVADDFWIPDPTDSRHRRSLMRNFKPVTDANVAKLKALGVTELMTITDPYDLVCEELCGHGHYSMKGDLYVLPKRAFYNFVHKRQRPATQPVVAEAPGGVASSGG